MLNVKYRKGNIMAKTKRFNFKIDPITLECLEKLAEFLGCSRAEAIARLIPGSEILDMALRAKEAFAFTTLDTLSTKKAISVLLKLDCQQAADRVEIFSQGLERKN